MGNADSTQKLGERVLVAKDKLEHEVQIQTARYNFLKSHSAATLNKMVESVSDSFSSCSPFLEPTLLIAWIHDSKKTQQIVLDSCRKVLSAPIKGHQYAWFKQYVFESSIWMLRTSNGGYMYEELLTVARNMSHGIIDSMESIYKHLKVHEKWDKMEAIKTQSAILRQDHPKVGLLKDKGLRDIFEAKKEDDDKEEAEDMKSFIDSNLAVNILTSTATNINQEFQNHIQMVMAHYGDFKPGPTKKVERCVSKLENDYFAAQHPKSAKLLDLVRCSVTFNTVDQLILGYEGLMKHISNNNGIIEMARVKNGFLGASNAGYRDLKVNVVYKSQLVDGLKMICEIQLMLINYLQEKKRIHKLYSILREEIYFQMVVEDKPTAKEAAITDLRFNDKLNRKDLKLSKYRENSVNKCSMDPETDLLCCEGIDWFGIIDIKKTQAVLEVKRDSPAHPWYGRQSHRWIKINGQKYLSVQLSKIVIKMYKVVESGTRNWKFVIDEKYTIKLGNKNGVINYVDFDGEFENIYLITNNQTLQIRSMKNVNKIVDSIKLEEQINQSSFRNLRFSNDGTICGLGGGASKNYFYLIDIKTKKQHKFTSNELSDTYAPTFINGENKYISVSDKQGRIEIWDIGMKMAVQQLHIGEFVWVTAAASTNNILAVGSWDKKLRLYDVRTWNCFHTRTCDTKATSLHLTSDLKYLTVGGSGGGFFFVLQIESDSSEKTVQ